MNNIKKYFLFFLLLEMFFSYAPAYAQTPTPSVSAQSSTGYNYANAGVSTQIEQYLCSPVSSTGTNSLFQCINQLYKFAIVIASVVGVFFIVIAGYVYMSAEGNNESVEKAKSILTSTITAIVILLAGYVLLRALNPDLVQFSSIQPPNVTLQINAPAVTTGTTGAPSGVITNNTNTSCNQSFGNSAASGCTVGTTCVDASALTPTHDCSSNNGVCLLSPTALSKARTLVSTFNQLGGSSGCTLKLSSAVQVNGPSVSACHMAGNSQTGTCADFNLIPYNATCAQDFYSAAQSANVVSFLDEYVQACVAGSTTGGNIHVNF